MDKKEMIILKNALTNEHGFKFICLLLEKLGAFERGINCNSNEKEIFKTLGKREQGLWLLDNILIADEEKYMEIMKQKKKEYINE